MTAELEAARASLLADQAACPFQAFARHRLGADTPELPDQVLDARERGTGVHEALCRLWREVASQAALRALSAEELERVLEAAVEAGLAAVERSRPELSPFVARVPPVAPYRHVLPMITVSLLGNVLSGGGWMTILPPAMPLPT